MASGYFDNKKTVGTYLVIWLLLWVYVFQANMTSAIEVWSHSNTYTHCFFILPAVAYFIWRSRSIIRITEPQLSVYFALLYLPWLLVWGIGYAGDLQLLSHIATIGLIPLTLLVAFGFRVAKVLWFPLTFMFFAVPIGEELVPFLQELTADNAVWMLNQLNVPIYRDGLYINIPSGQFVVAEACSGVRFLIASVCFGYFYAYITYVSFWRRIIFIAVSVALPILANAIRVFGIVLIGHYSEMEHAVGADHLIYGWFFFAIILLSLVWIGGFWREQSVLDWLLTEQPLAPAWRKLDSASIYAATFLPLLLVLLWQLQIDSLRLGGTGSLAADERLSFRLAQHVDDFLKPDIKAWEPRLTGQKEQIQAKLTNANVEIYGATFLGDRQGEELVSSSHRIYSPEQWSLERSSILPATSVGSSPSSYSLGYLQLVGVGGDRRAIVYWYQLENVVDSRSVLIKLRQALNRLLLKSDTPGYFIALSFQNEEYEDVEMQTALATDIIRSIHR